MEKKTKQRLEQLVRQGIVPSGKLPMLMQAMSSLHMGKQLSPTERKVLDKYMFNMTDIMLKDTTVFNRAKLHTQKTKYQTEETTVELDENVRVVDGEEDMQVRGREKEELKAKRLSIRKRDKYRLLSPELKKEKKKAGMDEEVIALNNSYQEMFEATLEYFEVSNIRDLPEEKKKEFFATVDEALEEAKMAKKDHDGDGKIETSTAEYMGSKDKAIKKAIKLRGFGPDKAKGNMGNPAARAALMRKEEANMPNKGIEGDKESPKQGSSAKPAVGELAPAQDSKAKLGEAMTPQQKADRLKTIAKAADRVQSGERDKATKKQAVKDMKSKAAQKGMAKVKQNDGDEGNHPKKLTRYIGDMHKEEVEQVEEAMTPEFKAKRLEMIRQAHDRVMTGKTRGASAAKSAAKSAMKQKGAQKGMAPTKKDVEEQVQELRKMIKEGNNKIEAYKLLSKILNNAENLGEQ